MAGTDLWLWEESSNLSEVIRCLRPLPSDKERQRTVVGKVAAALRESQELRESLRIAEIVSAGSHGRGTDIRNNLEVDLVVICNRFAVDAYDNMLENLAAFALANLDTEYVYAGKLRIMLKIDGIIVDLLIAGIMDRERLTRMHFMTPRNRKKWGASCSKLQLEFMWKKIGSTSVLRDGIVLVKHWKQTRKAVNDVFKWPSSWLLELLVTYAMDRSWSHGPVCSQPELFIPEPLNGVGLFLSTMQLICHVQCRQVPVVWMQESTGGCYEERDVRALLDYAERQDQPVVADPVDATNNVAAILSVADWSELAREARLMIQHAASQQQLYSELMAPQGVRAPEVDQLNPCSVLNELFQRLGMETPIYDREIQPAVLPPFISTVRGQLPCQCIIEAYSDERSTKKAAKRSAAEKAITMINEHICP
ncbi:unnamed protein product [Closterium sp. NIES-53]